MSEMIERVAKAIFDASSEHVVPNTQWEELTKMPQHAPIVTYYRVRAKAAIEAMREPTAAMYEAFLTEKDTIAPFFHGYQAAIDAALGVHRS